MEHTTVQALISTGASVVVTGLLVPLLFHYLKRKDDLSRRDFDLKYQEFKRYVAALDAAEAAARADYEKLEHDVFAPQFKAILEGKEPDLVGVQQAVAEFTIRSTTPLLQAKKELSGLRLIGSKSLVSLIDQYIQVQTDIVNALVSSTRNPNAHAHLKDIRPFLDPLGNRSQELYVRIIEQMRSELGIKNETQCAPS